MFHHKCPRCLKEWWSRVEHPIKCSRCQFRFDKFVEVIEEGENG